MKKYHFPLARLLALRRTEADLIRARLESEAAEVRRHEQMRAEIARQAAEASQGALRDGALGLELAGSGNFRDYARKADQMVAVELQKATEVAERTKKALMEAERRVKALETLDERGIVKWRKELAAEIEQFAAEAFLARWKRDEPRETPGEEPERPSGA